MTCQCRRARCLVHFTWPRCDHGATHEVCIPRRERYARAAMREGRPPGHIALCERCAVATESEILEARAL